MRSADCAQAFPFEHELVRPDLDLDCATRLAAPGAGTTHGTKPGTTGALYKTTPCRFDRRAAINSELTEIRKSRRSPTARTRLHSFTDARSQLFQPASCPLIRYGRGWIARQNGTNHIIHFRSHGRISIRENHYDVLTLWQDGQFRVTARNRRGMAVSQSR